MHDLRFSERECLANQTRQALAQCIVEALNMRRLPGFLATWTMFSDRNDCLIRFPKVGVAGTTPILGWNRAPKLATGGFITNAKSVSNNLPGLSTKCESNPNVIGLFCNE
ncbi:MAG: hypothetical protein IPO81_29605 [Kouleothrix sp.]|nr:hypothetical protein [Kouleothrix sp.]